MTSHSGTFARVGTFDVDVAFVEALPVSALLPLAPLPVSVFLLLTLLLPLAPLPVSAPWPLAPLSVSAMTMSDDFPLLGKASSLRLRRNRRMFLLAVAYLPDGPFRRWNLILGPFRARVLVGLFGASEVAKQFPLGSKRFT